MRIEEACPNVGDVAKKQDEIATRTKIDRFIIFDCRALSWRTSPAAGFGSLDEYNDWQPLVVKPETPSPWGEPVEWEELEVGEWYIVSDNNGNDFSVYPKEQDEVMPWSKGAATLYRFTPPTPPEPVKPPEWLGAVRFQGTDLSFVTGILSHFTGATLHATEPDGTGVEFSVNECVLAPDIMQPKPELAKLFEGGE